MNIVLDFKSVLLFQLCHLLPNADSVYDETFDRHTDSQYQDNDSDVDDREEYQHYRRPNGNYDYDYEKDNTIFHYSNDYDECNSCDCSMCNNPPDCCKEVCNSCYKISAQMSQIQMMSMPQTPQLSNAIPSEPSQSMPQIFQIPLTQNVMSQMPEIKISQMQMQPMQTQQMQMAQMQMPQLPQMPQVQKMPMLRSQMLTQQNLLPSPFPGQNSDQRLMYYPLMQNLMSFLKTNSVTELPNSNVTTNAVTETISITTNATLTTEANLTTVLITTSSPIQNKTVTHISHSKRLQSAFKKAISALTKSLGTSDLINRQYNRKVTASKLRRTRPVFSKKGTSKFGNNIDAASLVLEMRNAKGIRP